MTRTKSNAPAYIFLACACAYFIGHVIAAAVR